LDRIALEAKVYFAAVWRSRKRTSTARRGAGRALRRIGIVTRSDFVRLADAFEAALDHHMGRTDCLEARTDALETGAAARARTVDDLTRLMSIEALRRSLRSASLDESIGASEDWDLLLRLTAEKDPLVFPAVACYYATDAPRRLTNEPTRDAHHAAVHACAAAGPRP
jgi:hypothetical protein